MNISRPIYFTLILLLTGTLGFAQTNKPALQGWHLLDKNDDGYFGASVNKAYELLKKRKSNTVIIAVIDSGIDTTHEDIKPVLWRNPREIAGNGKDDDQNGYTDDLHGWNFTGGANGENLTVNSHEITRVYHKWKPAFEGKQDGQVPADKKFLFRQWVRAASIIDQQYEVYRKNFGGIDTFLNVLNTTNRLLVSRLKKNSFNRNDLTGIVSRDSTGWAAAVWTNIFTESAEPNLTNALVIADIEQYRNTLLNHKKRKEEFPIDTRGRLTRDDYENINDRNYGNHNLQTGSGNHGTHVAGIIGALRNNKGADGIVDNVRIMVIRAVPGGDEHDKDVALAIRYAVDNGASIINMSFGKPVSPYKLFVDDAVKYAASKNVLLVHGSGNDAENLDDNVFYPSPVFIDGTIADNMLTVGASGDYSTGGLTANFSNYSSKIVDLFAPGVNIYSTNANNGYGASDGTSMASPVAAGVAGLIKSYFPKLKPKQIIDLLLKTGTPVEEEVLRPGSNQKTSFKNLSKTGKIINATAAVQLALQLYGD